MSSIPLARSSGSVLGAILLVSGCCIGAGMLGLPILTGLAGFYPSLILFVISWLYMFCSGLLLLEVNLNFAAEDVSIVTMAERTLGPWGKWTAWVIFLFLFYCAMVAYVAGAGALVSDFFGSTTVGSLGICILLALVIFFGTGSVDLFNRLIMAGLIISYLLLVGAGVPSVQPKLLLHQNWHAALFVLPPMIFSFGFHNLIPSLTTYLGGERRRLTRTLFFGSLIPLVIYLIWETVILGIIPVEGAGSFREALNQGDMVTRSLKVNTGSLWILALAEYFAFFAIVTSFLAVALSFVDFLADGLQIEKNTKGKTTLCILTLLPPFLFAWVYPSVFQRALGIGGGIAAVLLFGVMPSIMVWKNRYISGENAVRPLLPGGKISILVVILFSVFVFLLELAHELGWTTP